MTIIRYKDNKYIPASHENYLDPGVVKKILYKRGQIKEGKLQMINWSRLGALKSFSLHYHESMSEIFIILNGKVEIMIVNEKEESKAILGKGDMVIIHPKERHIMRNIENKVAYYLAMGIAHQDGGKTINI